MRSNRQLIAAHNTEPCGHNGGQVIVWKEQNNPKSFSETEGVLSDVYNLKKEVWLD